jgi:predicted amidophosphoribosyltransferase
MKVVALPTISRHIRERGFDHMAKLARKVAELNQLEMARVLARGNNAVQVGASMEKRREQAKTAYVARAGIDTEANYLLIDDV